MTRRPIVLACLLVAAGCAGADAESTAADRPGQSSVALGEADAPAPACLGLGPNGVCRADYADADGGLVNVDGQPLGVCSLEPRTGFFRDGYCSTGPTDGGVHVVCAEMTDEFLTYTKDRGNDLSTPAPRFDFPGLEAGDRWCLCATRWEEARRAGTAPPVVLHATHRAASSIVDERHLRMAAVETTTASRTLAPRGGTALRDQRQQTRQAGVEHVPPRRVGAQRSPCTPPP